MKILDKSAHTQNTAIQNVSSDIKQYGYSTQILTLKITNFRWILTVYYVPKLYSLLAVIGLKLICPHGGLQVGKITVPDEQASWNDLLHFFSHYFSVSQGKKCMGHSTKMSAKIFWVVQHVNELFSLIANLGVPTGDFVKFPAVIVYFRQKASLNY